MKKTLTIGLLLSSLLTSAIVADDENQERTRASGVLKKLETHISQVSTESLLQMFYTDVNADTVNPVGSMYFVMRDGNILIKKELAKRVEKDRAILEKHLQDKRTLFTGYNGPHETVGHICTELLKEKKK